MTPRVSDHRGMLTHLQLGGCLTNIADSGVTDQMMILLPLPYSLMEGKTEWWVLYLNQPSSSKSQNLQFDINRAGPRNIPLDFKKSSWALKKSGYP